MTDLFAKKIEFNPPEKIIIDGRMESAYLRKVAAQTDTLEISLEEFKQNRVSGIIGTTNDGRRYAFIDRKTTVRIDADEVFKIDDASSVEACAKFLNSKVPHRLFPKPINPKSLEASELKKIADDARAAWIGKFKIVEEDLVSDTDGLRTPQVGAIHASLAHWSVSNNPATIVMPTGTGKTETMLALSTAVPMHRLMVVVPNDALRTQITNKFLSFGVLRGFGCLPYDVELPTVAMLTRIPKSIDEVERVFAAANVVVTTMSIAGRAKPAIQEKMAELSSHLFVDEAHHIGAKTWRRFRAHFKKKNVLQFTATPFRRDKLRVDGKHIYVYPLWKAQQEEYFKPINYIPVSGADDAETDKQIIDLVGQVLHADASKGFDHLVMARCDRKERADYLHSLYCAKYPEHNPLLLHSDVSPLEKDKAIARLRSREARIVVCVDMLGEGFDLPDLKIAALHDKHKSEAVTLQFIGRFTRSRDDLGEATAIANVALGDVNEPLKSLYAEDADWNELINRIGQSRTEREVRREEVFEGFSETPERFPLETLTPRMSTVVYKTGSAVWQPELIIEAFPAGAIVEGPHINEHERLAIFVKRDTEQPKWTSSKAVHNTEYNLYLVHWDEDQELLFVNSSKLKDMHEPLAKKIIGDHALRITGEDVYRCLYGVRRLCLNTLGLSETQRRPVVYSQFMGTDITPQIDELPGNRNRSKTNLFGQGYTNDGKITLGCSRKGKFWSYDATNNFGEWIDWCRALGRKLLDESVPTDAFLKNLVKPERQESMPFKTPIAIVWPERILDQDESRIEIVLDGTRYPIFNCEIQIADFSAGGPVRFSISCGERKCSFEMSIANQVAQYVQTDVGQISVSLRRRTLSIAEWFKEDPPQIYYADGDMLVDTELFVLPEHADRTSFDLDKLIPRDWTGVDITKESQGLEKRADSIQKAMIDQLIEEDTFDVVFDDDAAGEAADIVCIREDNNTLFVHLYHCKFSSEAKPGGRVADLYELCGQSQKSLRWRESPKVFLQHLRKREGDRRKKSTVSRYEIGDPSIVNGWLGRWSELSFRFQITAVQPGYSKKKAKNEHLELLAATSSLLMETWSIPFSLICSE
ncbi:DEAD/DEAH box helicase family protein [Ruegeria sp.]|uniref:DEAD/DEAH box helicase family protein n=1 Tax=Ruegeria sp. TaxID=1879320 RepID=UPI003C7E0168